MAVVGQAIACGDLLATVARLLERGFENPFQRVALTLVTTRGFIRLTTFIDAKVRR